MGARRRGQRGLGVGFAAAVCLGLVAGAQGAGDRKNEQVRPQVPQNPVITRESPDPEPEFWTAKEDAVLERKRPEYEPLGLEAGGIFGDVERLGRGQPLESFLLFPKVETELAFDDNILATDSDTEADFIGTLKPSLDLRSNWDNHFVRFEVHGEFGRYATNTRENYRRHGASITGRLDISEFETLRATLSSDRKTTARDDIDLDVGGDEPGVFYEHAARLDWQYQRDKLVWRLQGGVDRKNFVDVPAGLGEIEADVADRVRFELSPRVGWEAWKGTTVFAEPYWVLTRHDQETDGNGLQRDFSSRGFRLGATYDVSAVTFIEASLGLGFANPYDPASDAFVFVDPRLDFVWNPHDSWTFKLGYRRDVVSTNSFTTVNSVNVPDVAFLKDQVTAGVELEVMYDLLASADATYTHARTINGDTTDNVYETELALLWLMNEYSRLRGFWTFENFTSSAAAREFSKNQVGVVLTLQY